MWFVEWREGGKKAQEYGMASERVNGLRAVIDGRVKEGDMEWRV